MNLMEILDITSTNILLIFANIVLIILAIFLLFKLRKSIAKPEEEFEPGPFPNKENETDLTGIADIKPEEFNPERFDLNKDFFTPATPPKTTPVEMGSSAIQGPATLSMDAEVNNAGILKTDELELEDELLEEFAISQIESPEMSEPMKQEGRPEEKAPVPPEPEIAIPETVEEGAEEEFVVPHEPEKTVPEKEEVKTEEKVIVPIELEIPVIKKEEETDEEEFAVPFEPEITVHEKAEEKPIEKLSSPPELKLFTLDDKKKPKEISAPASTELLTSEKAEEQQVTKASKRKSLF